MDYCGFYKTKVMTILEENNVPIPRSIQSNFPEIILDEEKIETNFGLKPCNVLVFEIFDGSTSKIYIKGEKYKGIINKGTYGTCFKIIRDQPYCLKICDIKKEMKFFNLKLRHPNVIDLIESGERYMIFPYAEQSLHSLISDGESRNKVINPKLRADLINELLRGVSFLHEHKILHLDLKPYNLLIFGNMKNRTTLTLKIADFGSCMNEDEKKKFSYTTVPYAPPESENLIFSTASDIWSVGCITVALLGIKAVEAGMFVGCYKQKEIDDKLIGLHSNERSIASRCLKIEPSERLSAKEFL